MRRFRIGRNAKKKNIVRDRFPENRNEPLSEHLHENEETFRSIFRSCFDVSFRRIEGGGAASLLLYLESIVDEQKLDQFVLKPFLAREFRSSDHSRDHTFPEPQLIPVGSVHSARNVDDVVRAVLSGQAAILQDGVNCASLVDLIGRENRSLSDPPTESVIRGPRVGFIENIAVNTGLLRSGLRSPDLKMESFTVGDRTQTKVVVTYLEGVAAEGLVEEVRQRIARIEIDGVLESAYIGEFIEDLPSSPFPQVQNTERPDVVIAALLEGRVGILVDGTPFALIVPMTFWMALQSGEDYYERFFLATSIRLIRALFLTIALFLPSFYVAITTFHQEMVPTSLLLSIMDAREAIPFPALIEALLMEVTFEALREAGVRLPRVAGQAVSIVGGLVIGQAAVEAGIVSAPMVIVVSITGIASFTIPRFNLGAAVRILRFPMIVLAGTLGLYGISLGFLLLLLHVSSLRSFGVPYFSPVAPFGFGTFKDVFVRIPRWANNLRPSLSGSGGSQRVKPGQKPGPPSPDHERRE